ncbi:unnamed protein product [Prorocentrum cordatum]|uniref:Tetratricopeptide repeat protein n=1 Tax=Prorocentrum cordatum TaxID=2364126 RepID=A0ABN9S5R1_9DINO|nr:unnamed protein product [Polarella glacialis]
MVKSGMSLDRRTNLALCYKKLGRPAKAVKLLRVSYAAEELHYGKGHLSTAGTLGHLAEAHGARGNLGKMRSLLAESLGLLDDHFGHDHEAPASSWPRPASPAASPGTSRRRAGCATGPCAPGGTAAVRRTGT